MPEIKDTKKSEIHRLESGEFKMDVNVLLNVDDHGAKKLQIFDKDGEKQFVFYNSTPETVRAIGELLIKASTL